LRFVVQKHAASHLHYDFRLELDGVLKSWAVPKGPDLNPANKRLAMAVEDHPVEYGEFEGIIPPGEYGGGTVMIWDQGTWQPDDDPRQGLREGRLKFTLLGEKLRGGWMLVRRGGRSSSADERTWFLFKERDRFARTTGKSLIDRLPRSVTTGRTLEQIADQSDRVWGSNGEVRKRRTSSRPETLAGVALTHPEKILYPDQALTKTDLANYYAAVADWMIPHNVDRPAAGTGALPGR
jgi:bifunctional non-homologous end joining protein LigD